jgi:hypothetical protein
LKIPHCCPTIIISIYLFINTIIALRKKQDKISNKIKENGLIKGSYMVFVDITQIKRIYFFCEVIGTRKTFGDRGMERRN